MKILATDLDRTLLPNGKWKLSKGAIEFFNDETQRTQGLNVIYVTGRTLELVECAIDEYGIRCPNYLIGAVGTKVYSYENQKFVPDNDYEKYVLKKCPNWDRKKIVKILSSISELELQEESLQNEFKISYYTDGVNGEEVIAKAKKLIEGKFDEEIIFSFDPIKKKGLLDVLPKAATKKTALLYLIDKLKVSKDNVVYAGDSGNDILPMMAGFKSILVKNADKHLRDAVKIAISKNEIKEKNIYVAKGFSIDKKQIFNGNYTAGVIEGLLHFNFL
ncbi:MAG: HAD-IIB family hydrolase [Nanoarchaeota archaeon]